MSNENALAKSVEIAVPVLNEEATLELNIGRILNYLEGQMPDYSAISLVIADNGSTDRTIGIATALQRQYPGKIRLVTLGERGVGGALKAAWTTSGAAIVGYMDLDLATDLAHLRPAISAIADDGYDVVTGSRLAAGAVVTGRSLKRAVISRVFNGFLRAYLRASFTDGMCGFKFLRRDLVPTLISHGADSRGWFFATELLLVAQHLKLRVLDLPVRWTDDPSSKVRVWPLTREYIRAARALKKRLRPARS